MFDTWKQTTPYTCGPSSLMTSFAETKGEVLSHEHEMGIWRGAVPALLRPILASLIGTPPCALAKYTEKRVRGTRLHIFRENYRQIHGMRRFKYRIAVFLHDTLGVFLFSRSITEYHKGLEMPEWIYQALTENPAHRMLLNIVIEHGVIHFVLVRKDDEGRLVVMDPLPGKNTFYSLDEFRKEIGPVIFGYSILMPDTATGDE